MYTKGEWKWEWERGQPTVRAHNPKDPLCLFAPIDESEIFYMREIDHDPDYAATTVGILKRAIAKAEGKWKIEHW